MTDTGTTLDVGESMGSSVEYNVFELGDVVLQSEQTLRNARLAY